MSAAEPYTYRDRYEGMYLPAHPLASKGGFVFTHRKVLYEKLGPGEHPCHWCERPVTWETDLHVDHLNDDRLDNRADNVVATCQRCNIARTAGTLEARLRKRLRYLRIRDRLDALDHWRFVTAHARRRPVEPSRSQRGYAQTPGVSFEH